MSVENPGKNHNMNSGVGPTCANTTGSAPDSTAPQHLRLAHEWLLSFDSPHTVQVYRRDADALFSWCAAFGVDPMEMTPVLADGYRQHLAGRYRIHSTRARHLAVCSSFYKFVRARYPDLGVDNPFAGTRRPKVSKDSVMNGLSLDQAAALLDYAEFRGPREAVIAHVLLSTGMRVSELVNANSWDIRRDGDHHTIAITRKGGRTGRVPLPPEAVAAVRAYVGTRAGPILVNRGGGRVLRQQVSVELDRMARACGLPRLTPHRLRHTAATVAIQNGQTVEQVQEMLGHVDIATTMRYYHASRAVERSAVHGLAAAYRRARSERQAATPPATTEA